MFKFYVNLMKLLEKLTKSSPTFANILYHSLKILKKSANTSQRKLITTTLDFIPVLAELLPIYPNERAMILELLQDLTIDFKELNHNSYLDDLIEVLVEYAQKESDYSRVALGVLVNLCFKNPGCIFELVEQIR